jgi:hypothetical protein
MCAAAVAIDRFSAFGATAQPANSSVKNATTIRLTAPPLSILFFMNPFICLIQPAQHRVYSTPSDKKGLIDQNPPGTNCPPASQDRARSVFDRRMRIDPSALSSSISATLYGAALSVIEYPAPSTTILAMKKSIILFSALYVVAVMLASCESMLNSFNPFSPETTTTSTSDSPVTSQTNRATYEVPLGRGSEHYIPTDY